MPQVWGSKIHIAGNRSSQLAPEMNWLGLSGLEWLRRDFGRGVNPISILPSISGTKNLAGIFPVGKLPGSDLLVGGERCPNEACLLGALLL